MRIVSCRLFLVLLAGGVAGCNSGKTDQSNGPVGGSVGIASVAPAPVVAAAPHPKRAHAVQAPPVARPQIDELIGWDEAEIKTVFGAPTAQEDDAPTKRWVYHARQCTMNVTLYPEVDTRQFHALNYEVNADDGSAKRQQACVAEFSSRLPAKPLAK